MVLEDPNRIDLIMKPKNGKMELLIADAGITTDPLKRFQLLTIKLRTYVNYILSDEFKKEFPNIKPKEVTITVAYNTNAKPTKDMKNLVKIGPHGDKNNMIAIKYESIDSIDKSKLRRDSL